MWHSVVSVLDHFIFTYKTLSFESLLCFEERKKMFLTNADISLNICPCILHEPEKVEVDFQNVPYNRIVCPSAVSLR